MQSSLLRTSDSIIIPNVLPLTMITMKFKFVLLTLLSFSLSVNAQSAKKKKQLQTVATEITRAMDDGDTQALDRLFDTEAFADRIIVKSTSNDLKEFNAGFLSSLREQSLLSRMLITNPAVSDSDYELVRAYFDKKDGHLIFRLYGEAGMNYHDFLIRKIGGKYKVIDIYVYLSGEYLGSTFKRIYLMSNKAAFASGEVEGMPDLKMDDLSKLMTAKGLVDRGEYEAANESLAGLSSDVRKEKLFMLIELVIKSNMTDEDYLQVMEDFKIAFPDDPSIYLMSIDYLLLKEEYEAAHEAIDKLDKAVGGDTFLDLQRGLVFYIQGNPQKAEELLLRFTGNHPGNYDAWYYLLNIYVESKKFEQAISALQTLINTYDLGREDMTEVLEEEPSFADFINSEEYKNWKSKKN